MVKKEARITKKLIRELEMIKEEVRNDVTGPVVASFGFIIALIWRDAIKAAIDRFLLEAGLIEKAYIYNFISAIIVTIIVIGIMVFVTKMGREWKKEKIDKAIKNIEKKDKSSRKK